MSFDQEEKESEIVVNENRISLLESCGDNMLIAVADSTIIIWNVTTGERMHTLKEHSDQVTSLLVVSGGSEFITGSLDGTIRIFDVKTGALNFSEKCLVDRIFSLYLLHNDESIVAILGLTKERTPCIQVKQLRGNVLDISDLPRHLKIKSINIFFE